MYDVIIVGMGPAGASAAFELSQRGFSVLAFDKESHPRYKVCGGGLSARISKIVPDDFFDVVEESIYRVQFAYAQHKSFLIESSQPIAYMVMRSNFDQWLVEKAQHAGTTIHETEQVIEIQRDDACMKVLTKRNGYRSRVVIGADGAMSVVAQQCFPGRNFKKIPAVESEVFQAQPHTFQETGTAFISLHAAKKGYGWIFPKKSGLSLGVGEFVQGAKRPKQSYRRFIHSEPTLSELDIPAPLGHPIPVVSSHMYNTLGGWKGQLVNGRALLVGDAGHLVDPLLGEGIYYAVRSGQLAARSVTDMLKTGGASLLEQYEAAAAQEFGREFRIAGKLRAIIYGVPRSLHRWAGYQFPVAYHGVLRRYCEVLQGNETYEGLWNRMRERLSRPFSV